MEWWNFQDSNFVVFFIIILMVFILSIFVVGTFIIVNRFSMQYDEKIKRESISTRIFAIDVKNDSVVFFNRSDMKHKRKMNLSSFYFHFHQNDTEKVQQWIYSIITDPKGCDQYLEADVLVNRGKATYFSLLKLIKYDPSKGIIHLESHILRYITPTNFSSKKKDALSGVVKRSTMKGIITKSKSLRGFTFAIRFFYVRQKALSNEKIERYMMMTLKNEVYPYADNRHQPRQIIDDSGNEILLFDIHIQSRDEAMQLAASISHSLKKCIGVNGYSDSVNFAIGVVENAQFYQDFDMIVQKSQEACITAQQNAQDVFIYQKSHGPIYQELNKFNNEVDKLLDTIARREHGLAFYIFTKNKKWAKKVMQTQQYGGGCINEVCLHLMVKGVPFNGVGHSGMGAYHGIWGFKEFTHPSTVLFGHTKMNLSLREHPYNEKKKKMLSKFLK